MNRKKITGFLLSGLLFMGIVSSQVFNSQNITYAEADIVVETDVQKEVEQKEKKAKYVFLFIGDGNALGQVSAAENYLGAINSNIPSVRKLSFTEFEAQGITTTYSTNSFITDSAAAGTAIATGKKTNSGMISMTPDGTEVKTIAEIAKESGMRIGIVSTTTINHATPAVFYSHNESRKNYYDIGVDMINSNFDYFGGGIMNKHDKGDKDLYLLAEEKGYTVIDTNKEFENLTEKDGKVIATSPVLYEGSIPYTIDQDENVIDLADFTRKGIQVLDNENGFFMMVEGGKIDWACHANDAVSSIYDTIGFNDAIDEAINFYNEHPDETLILVTADHETGGLTLGFAGTGYSNFYDILQHQKVSYDVFDDIIQVYREEKGKNAEFSHVMKLINENFGLKFYGDEEDNMVLTYYEIQKLHDAFEESMKSYEQRNYGEEENLIYGYYDPLTVTVTHILNQKAGLAWTSYSHTGTPVPTYAEGVNSTLFNGYYDNTDIFNKLLEAMGMKK